MVIRTLLEHGKVINQIIEETGFTYNYCHKVVRKYPEWKAKEDVRFRAKVLTRMLRGENVKLFDVIVKFLHYTATHVYFINTNGKIENMEKEDFIGEMAL